MKREDLFDLAIGKMEDQLHFFIQGDTPISRKNTLLYDDGLFYLANGPASKLMEFTRFGELTLLLYQPANNPEPVMLPKITESASKEILTRRAVAVPFQNIGSIGIDTFKNIYIEDQIATKDYRDENGTILRKIIRRYDRYGNALDIIGREGINGTPFSYIRNFTITENNNLVVVTQTKSNFVIYWFSPEMKLLYELVLDPELLPRKDTDPSLPTLDTIFPDFRENKLYLMLTYFQYGQDTSTKIVNRIIHSESRIYTFDLKTQSYASQFVSIPAETASYDLFSKDSPASPTPYTLLGISENGYFYLLKMRNNTSYQLLVLNDQGNIFKKARLFIDNTDVIFLDFYLSRDGLIYALIGERTQARITWWRSDQLGL
ncbi:MAG: hypothetical protein JW904_09780 [Spirochaetales bacterium]|nr:hypothetical protein [Spirochaetales bacterium]